MSDDIPKLDYLLFYVVGLKRRALNNNDKELFECADKIEHELKLLMNKKNLW